jgi:hypothetical protein
VIVAAWPMALKISARDGRPMNSLASLHKSSRAEENVAVESVVETAHEACSTGFLFLEYENGTKAAVIPFVGAVFGVTKEVKGSLVLTRPIHADGDIENSVCTLFISVFVHSLQHCTPQLTYVR